MRLARLSVAVLTACTVTPAARAPATLEGDLYYLTRSGDVKKGAGLTVKLFVQPDSILAKLSANCADFEARHAPLAKQMEKPGIEGDWQKPFLEAGVLADAVIAKANASLSSAFATSNTGVNAHYRFENVAPGRYLLFARWTVLTGQTDRILQWVVPVDLLPGTKTVVDLDTDKENHQLVFCGLLAPGEH